MNRVILIGRISRDIEIRYSSEMAIAKFNLAVDRMNKDEADFISCVAFGKTAESMNKYTEKGKKIAIEGHIQTGSYQKQDGSKVYTTDVIVDRAEYLEWKKKEEEQEQSTMEGFMKVPDSLEDDGLPFG